MSIGIVSSQSVAASPQGEQAQHVPQPATPVTSLWVDGLWTNNPGLVQMLGLCPLLAVSNTFENALTLGLATLLTLLVSNGLISVLRHQLQPETRIIVYVLVIASVVSLIDLLMQAFQPELHRVIGLFIPLIVTNCMIIGRAEIFASRHALLPSLVDALAMGFGFMLVLSLLGLIRDQLAQAGALIAILPPGAFVLLGLMVAMKNWIDLRNVP